MRLVILVLVLTLGKSRCRGQEINFSPPQPYHPIQLDAQEVTTWRLGDSELIHLKGKVAIQQSAVLATADESIVWVQTGEDPTNTKRVVVYLEGEQVVIRRQRNGAPHSETGHEEDAITDKVWLGRLFTDSPLQTRTKPSALTGQPPPILQRAIAFHRQQGTKLSAPFRMSHKTIRTSKPLLTQEQVYSLRSLTNRRPESLI